MHFVAIVAAVLSTSFSTEYLAQNQDAGTSQVIPVKDPVTGRTLEFKVTGKALESGKVSDAGVEAATPRQVLLARLEVLRAAIEAQRGSKTTLKSALFTKSHPKDADAAIVVYEVAGQGEIGLFFTFSGNDWEIFPADFQAQK